MASNGETIKQDEAAQEETVAEVLAHMTKEVDSKDVHAQDAVAESSKPSNTVDDEGASLLCSEEDVDSQMSAIAEESEQSNSDDDDSSILGNVAAVTCHETMDVHPAAAVDVAVSSEEVSIHVEAIVAVDEVTCEGAVTPAEGVFSEAAADDEESYRENYTKSVDSESSLKSEAQDACGVVATDDLAVLSHATRTPPKANATHESTTPVRATPPAHSTPTIPLNAPSYDLSDPHADVKVEYLNNGDGFFDAASTKQMLPSSAKKLPLTHPTSPDLRSAKRNYRCADHACTHDSTKDTATNLHLEDLPRDPSSTEPHSPFLLTAQRAKLKPVEPASTDEPHVVQAADLMRRDHSPQVYIAKTTVPHSPFLATAQRAKMHPNAASTATSYDGGFVDPAALVQRTTGHNDKENAGTMHHSGLRPTRPHSPNLRTNKRTRTPFEVEDVDAAELAKPFHATPMPSLKRRKVVAVTSSTTTTPVSPNLESVRRHKAYQEEFHSKIQADAEAASLRRVFKAAPLPLYDTVPGLNPNVKRMPLTEIEPFHMPGDRFDELAKERLAKLKMDEEKARVQKMVFKATPIMAGSRSFLAKKVEAKPLTECASPDLAVKRRAVARAEFDSKDKARREMEDAAARRKMEIAKEEDAAALRAYRATLSFKHHT